MHETAVAQQANALYEDNLNAIHRRGDRLFALLLILQWLGGIGLAFSSSPSTPVAGQSLASWHLWAAIYLGGILTALPVYLAWRYPGRFLTRHAIASGIIESSVQVTIL